MIGTLFHERDGISLWRGDARNVSSFIAPESVDLIITSPPYFALRSYTDNGEHYDGQIGSEPSPREFVDALIACTADWMKVLKPGGSIWVNLGDKFSGAGAGGGNGSDDHRAGRPMRDAASTWASVNPANSGIRSKSLMGLPWRYALRCIDDLGLILRRDVIWSKPNGMPESVTDRCRSTHEYWFHFTKEPTYFAAVDHLREPHQPQSIARSARNRFAPDRSQDGVGSPNTLDPAGSCHPLGALPGSVWTIATEPLVVPPEVGVDHFAAFPTEWPRRIILGWSPSGICVECGEARQLVTSRESDHSWADRKAAGEPMRHGLTGAAGAGVSNVGSPTTTIDGEQCACVGKDIPPPHDSSGGARPVRRHGNDSTRGSSARPTCSPRRPVRRLPAARPVANLGRPHVVPSSVGTQRHRSATPCPEGPSRPVLVDRGNRMTGSPA